MLHSNILQGMYPGGVPYGAHGAHGCPGAGHHGMSHHGMAHHGAPGYPGQPAYPPPAGGYPTGVAPPPAAGYAPPPGGYPAAQGYPAPPPQAYPGQQPPYPGGRLLLYPRHTKYVEGYIFSSFCASVRLSVQMLTFCVKVLREAFSFCIYFWKLTL